MTAAILFVCTFALVFGLGVQSLNVNGGHYKAAFITSFVIGGANLILYKLTPDASALECVGYLFGGPFGIVAAMKFHAHTIGRKL